MTKTPGITPITTTPQTSGAADAEPPQAPKAPQASAALDGLKGQIHKDPSAESSFATSEEFQDSYENSDSDNRIDANSSLSFQSVKIGKTRPSLFSWIGDLGRSLSPGPGKSTLSVPHPQGRSTATPHRSRSPSVSAPSIRQREAAARTFEHMSPHHRMNATQVWPDFQRDYFLLQADKKGYHLAETEERLPPNTAKSPNSYGRILDDELYAQWHALNGGKISAAEFFRHRAGQTREERIAFALNLARLIASRDSVRLGPILSDSLNSVSQQYDDYTKRLSQAPTPRTGLSPIPNGAPASSQSTKTNNIENGFPDFETANLNINRLETGGINLREDRSVSSKSIANSPIEDTPNALAAKQIDAQELRDVKLLELHDDPIENAQKTLRNLLKPSTDNTDQLGGAERVNWSPCRNDNEVQEVINLFTSMCNTYRPLVDARVEAVEKNRIAMRNGALPRLGMAVELRGGKLANSIRNDAAEDFINEKGWHTEKTFKNFLKDVLAGVAKLFRLKYLSPRIKDFINSRYSTDYRIEQIEGHANLRQTNELKEKNRALAKKWVTDTFKGDDEYGRPKSLVNNANELTKHYGGWDVKDEDLVAEITKQLELATKADILITKEREAMRLGLPVNHPAVQVPDEDYLLDESFLNEMARGIIEGVSEGLHEAGLPLETPSASNSPIVEQRPNLGLEPIPSGVVVNFAGNFNRKPDG
ncbi:MAG: hypothetical protein AAGC95_01365 [Pseudomonadota bacterium]